MFALGVLAIPFAVLVGGSAGYFLSATLLFLPMTAGDYLSVSVFGLGSAVALALLLRSIAEEKKQSFLPRIHLGSTLVLVLASLSGGAMFSIRANLEQRAFLREEALAACHLALGPTLTPLQQEQCDAAWRLCRSRTARTETNVRGFVPSSGRAFSYHPQQRARERCLASIVAPPRSASR